MAKWLFSPFTTLTVRKILIVTPRVPYPLKDGGNLATHAMIEGYMQAGWQVSLLSMNTPQYYVQPQVLNGLYRHLESFQWMDFSPDARALDAIKNYLLRKTPAHVAAFYQPAFGQKILDVIAANDPDVVQMESVFLSPYLPAIKNISSAVIALRSHHLEYMIWHGLLEKNKNKFRKVYFSNVRERLKDFERKWWKEYDIVIPIAEKDAYHIKRHETVNAMLVAPYSVDPSLPQIVDSDATWVGCHLGVMDALPNNEGIDWFLTSAWPRIVKAVPKFEFYYAGRNMPDAFARNTPEGTFCLGEVDDAAAFLADKKIFIAPIWSGGGMQVKVLEAMAAGKVVIATPMGMRGIDARPGEHFQAVHKTEDFIRAIKWALANPLEATQMAANGRRLVMERYTHAVVMGRVVRELEALVASRRG